MVQDKISYPYLPDFQISPLSSLNFDHQWRLPWQYPCCYIQKFITLDKIRVQYAATDRYPFNVYLKDQSTGTSTKLTPEVIKSFENTAQNTQGNVYEIMLNQIDPGCYTLEFYIQLLSEKLMAISYFEVLPQSENTMMRITYTNRRNEFDTVFADDRLFDFRVEGCLLPGDTTFGVDSEGFRDQSDRYRQLSALPYRTDTLSIGGGSGVPVWVADKLNFIFSTSFVMIDEMKYTRGDGAVPEVTSLHADYPMFIYKLQVEKDRTFQYQGRYGGDFNFDYNQDYNTVRYDI